MSEPTVKVSLQIGNKRMAIVTEDVPADVEGHITNCAALLGSWWQEAKDLPEDFQSE